MDYHFVARAKFEEMIHRREFLEYAEVFGNLYGTPKTPVEAALAAGKDVLMDVDVQGAMELSRNRNSVFIFLLPPSMHVLEQRLMQRKTESEAQIQKRIANARHEMSYVKHYDYTIFNEDINESIRLLKSIVRAERCRTSRNKESLSKLGFKG